jgi:hypothetical protein
MLRGIIGKNILGEKKKKGKGHGKKNRKKKERQRRITGLYLLRRR